MNIIHLSPFSLCLLFLHHKIINKFIIFNNLKIYYKNKIVEVTQTNKMMFCKDTPIQFIVVCQPNLFIAVWKELRPIMLNKQAVINKWSYSNKCKHRTGKCKQLPAAFPAVEVLQSNYNVRPNQFFSLCVHRWKTFQCPIKIFGQDLMKWKILSSQNIILCVHITSTIFIYLYLFLCCVVKF